MGPRPGGFGGGTVTTAGIVGLGSQGAGMAQRIIAAPGLAELGDTSDVVGICVTDDAAAREVTLGPTGVRAGMAPGSILTVHSTIGTATCTEVAEAADGHGVAVIDAPVSGGGAAAAAGALTVYVGGSEDVGLFGLELLPTGGVERAALLTAADRLLGRVGHPRSADPGSIR
jgi:3-hydroxyisobutyrate dehydrogenase-like beta-hydroxyacid dehydrogenase